MFNYKLKDKIVIVTGASKGFGKCIVKQFLLSEATVVMATSSPEAGAKTCEELKEFGTVDWVKVDLRIEEDIINMIRFTVEKYGRVDFLINNAAVTTDKHEALHEIDSDFAERMIAVNVFGTYKCMKHAITQMLEQGGGGIVNVSSATSLNVQKGLAVYAATKSAINTMTRYAAVEYGAKGIRVNALLAGGIKGEALAALKERDPKHYAIAASGIPLGDFADPVQLAQNIVWMCSEEGSYLAGANVVVDGGLCIS